MGIFQGKKIDMTTNQAFKKVLKMLENKDDAETRKSVGMSQNAVRQLRSRFKQGAAKQKTMERILKKVGGKKIPEHWEIPESI